MDKMNIILSGLEPTSQRYTFNERLIKVYKKFPQMFYDDVAIVGIFGNFSCAKHASMDPATTKHRTGTGSLQQVYEFTRNNDLFVILDAGSRFIQDNSIHDYYDNVIYDIFHDSRNFVATVDSRIADLIQREYPSYQILTHMDSCLTGDECLDYLDTEQLAFVNPAMDYNMLKESDSNYAIVTINPWCHWACKSYFNHRQLVQNTLYHYRNEMEAHVPTERLNNHWPNPAECPNRNRSINSIKDNVRFLDRDSMTVLHGIGVRFFIYENWVYESMYNMIETALRTIVKPEASAEFRFLMSTGGGV